MCVFYLFGRKGPRWFILFFAEVCVFHVGSCRGGGACAQLVLVPVPGVHAFAHKALHRLDHVFKVLGVGGWVAL